jgi:hypothetical protein
MGKENQQLTSVKVDSTLFEEFKINSIKYKFSLQRLTEHCMYLFNTDIEFRKRIQNLQVPKSIPNKEE